MAQWPAIGSLGSSPCVRTRGGDWENCAPRQMSIPAHMAEIGRQIAAIQGCQIWCETEMLTGALLRFRARQKLAPARDERARLLAYNAPPMMEKNRV